MTSFFSNRTSDWFSNSADVRRPVDISRSMKYC